MNKKIYFLLFTILVITSPVTRGDPMGELIYTGFTVATKSLLIEYMRNLPCKDNYMECFDLAYEKVMSIFSKTEDGQCPEEFKFMIDITSLHDIH